MTFVAPPITPADKSSASPMAPVAPPIAPAGKLSAPPRAGGAGGGLLDGILAGKKLKKTSGPPAEKSVETKEGKSLQVANLEEQKDYKIVSYHPGRDPKTYVAKLKKKKVITLTWVIIKGQPFWEGKEEASFQGAKVTSDPLTKRRYEIFPFKA